MNRKQRRALGIAPGEQTILGAQQRSRVQMRAGIIGWAKLLGATYTEPSTQAILTTQRDGVPIVVTCTVAVRPPTPEETRTREPGQSWNVPTHFVEEDGE